MIKQKDDILNTKKKNEFSFIVRNKQVCFSGNFDSGNLQKVEQLTPYIYRITSGYDHVGYPSKKSIFHYKVTGFSQCTVTFLINRIKILEPFINNDKFISTYHPVFKNQSEKQYKKIKQSIKLYYNMSGEPEISFNHSFTKQQQTYFAFTYPYSYQDGQKFIKQMLLKFKDHPQIKFQHCILGLISNKYNIDLIKISNKQTEKNKRLNFLEKYQKQAQVKKPKVLITGRVHPGESPSSFCAQGIIRYLLNQQDQRSYLLRKHFEFIIVPMLNPEGVYEGYFRSDTNGFNLNRIYGFTNQKITTSIGLLKNYISSIENIDFYFDLHSHSSLKDFFIYGNYFKQLDFQVESQLFGNIIQYICPYFSNIGSIFSQTAMKSKDRHDKFTKQGCGRVYFHKKYNIIHSYTVECGFFFPSYFNNHYIIQQQSTLKNRSKQTKDWELISKDQFTPQVYMFLGKSILNSILDLFNLNPYSKVSKKREQNLLDKMRIEIGQDILDQYQRFNMRDASIMKKIKNQPGYIEKRYYEKKFGYCGLSTRQISQQKSTIKTQRFDLFNKWKNHVIQFEQVQSKKQIDSSIELQSQQKEDNKFQFVKHSKINDIIGKKLLTQEAEDRKYKFYEYEMKIGKIHQQLFKKFAVYDRSSEKKVRIKTQTKSIFRQTSTKFYTKKDNKKQQSPPHVNKVVNNIKKDLLLNLLNKKSQRSQKMDQNMRRTNIFRIINGKQESNSNSLTKKGKGYHGSLKKLKFSKEF